MTWLPDGIAFVWYGSVLATVGAVGAARVFASADNAYAPAWRQAALRVARLAAPLLLLALLARLGMQTWLAFGGDRPMSLDLAVIILRDTYWGWGWTWQLLAGLACWVALAPSVTRGRRGWIVPLVAASGVGASVALTGHAAGVESGLASVTTAHAVHVIAAGLWLGTLAVVLRVTRQTNLTSAGARAAFAQAIAHFSPQALVAVITLAASGLVSAWEYVDSVAALLSPYGFVLIAKIIAFGSAGLCGVYNWRVVRPVLAADPNGPDQLRSMAGLELAFGVAALILTSILTSMDAPH